MTRSTAILRSTPTAPAHLSAFVTADLRFDIAAIKADAKARYARKFEFINGYTGRAKRHWQWSLARRAMLQAWKEAKWQLHCIVFDRVPHELPYTAEEAARVALLRNRINGAAITAQGNAEFKTAAGEYAQINSAAHRRAYFAIIRQAGGGRGITNDHLA